MVIVDDFNDATFAWSGTDDAAVCDWGFCGNHLVSPVVWEVGLGIEPTNELRGMLFAFARQCLSLLLNSIRLKGVVYVCSVWFGGGVF